MVSDEFSLKRIVVWTDFRLDGMSIVWIFIWTNYHLKELPFWTDCHLDGSSLGRIVTLMDRRSDGSLLTRIVSWTKCRLYEFSLGWIVLDELSWSDRQTRHVERPINQRETNMHHLDTHPRGGHRRVVDRHTKEERPGPGGGRGRGRRSRGRSARGPAGRDKRRAIDRGAGPARGP